MKSIRISIANSNEFSSALIGGWLVEQGAENVSAFESENELFEALCSRKVDVVLFDLSAAIAQQFDNLRRVKQCASDVKLLVVITKGSLLTDVLTALDAGADGIFSRQSSPEQLSQAVRSVACGAGWLDSSISQAVLKTATTQESPALSRALNQIGLTIRELQVLDLVVLGKSNAEIASELGITYQTVKTHVRHLSEKMNVQNRTEIAVRALKAGIAGLP